MRLAIDLLTSDSLDLWNNPGSFIPLDFHSYTIEEQLQKETDVDRLMRDVDSSMGLLPKRASRSGKKRIPEVRGRIQRAIVQLLHSFDCVIDQKMESEFSTVTDEFVRRACEFDPDIDDEAVYQASRNLLIMNTIQMYLGKEVSLSPSAFAYSMLYPYTDNYLDAVDVDMTMKYDASERLLLRLSGISVPARNGHERAIDRLVGMIEREFDRTGYPRVYESLLAIHRGQTRSVSQCGRAGLPSDQLLTISIEKGGASVLADGYLVAGDLSDDDARFLFRFGVLLQLIDDLQDIEEDCSHGQATLVGLHAEQNSLPSFTDRLLAFLDAVVGPDAGGQSTEQAKLRLLIERSSRLLIFEAIACNECRYGERYLTTMQQRSPVRFDYLREVQKRLKEKYSSHRTGTYGHMRNAGSSPRNRMMELAR